jgi:hypothetical protein
MTREEIKAATLEHGEFDINPVLLPEDAPPEVKSALLRLYNQGRKDLATLEDWLNE